MIEDQAILTTQATQPASDVLPTDAPRRRVLAREVWAFALRRPVLATFVVALALRVLVAVGLSLFVDHSVFLDNQTYSTMAAEKADGDTAGWDAYTRELYRFTGAFLVPLTLLYKVTGEVELLGQLFVAVFGALTAAFVTRLALEVLERRWALLGGMVVAVWPSQVLFSAITLKDTLVWCTLAGMALALATMSRTTSWRIFPMIAALAVLLYFLSRLRLQRGAHRGVGDGDRRVVRPTGGRAAATGAGGHRGGCRRAVDRGSRPGPGRHDLPRRHGRQRHVLPRAAGHREHRGHRRRTRAGGRIRQRVGRHLRRDRGPYCGRRWSHQQRHRPSATRRVRHAPRATSVASHAEHADGPGQVGERDLVPAPLPRPGRPLGRRPVAWPVARGQRVPAPGGRRPPPHRGHDRGQLRHGLSPSRPAPLGRRPPGRDRCAVHVGGRERAASAVSARVAVVGCGEWGKNLVRIFDQLGALEAINDVDPAAVDRIQARIPIVARGFAELLDDPRVEAVAIATNAVSHAALAGQALKAGKHVFVEKPLALDVDEAEELCGLAEDSGRVLMVGHLLQYHPAFVSAAGRGAAAAQLGRLQYIYSNRLNLGRFRREENILWSFAPHDISMILALVGIRARRRLGGRCRLPAPQRSPTSRRRTSPSPAASGPTSSCPGCTRSRSRSSSSSATAAWRCSTTASRGTPSSCSTRTRSTGATACPSRVARRREPVAARAGRAARDRVPALPRLRRARRTPAHRRPGGRARAAGAARQAERSMELGTGRAVLARPNELVHPSRRTSTTTSRSATARRSGTSATSCRHARSAANCVIGQNVMLGPDVTVGDRCKIQNNVSVYKGVTLEDGVFCGPSCVFTNVINPRAEIERKDEFRRRWSSGAPRSAPTPRSCAATRIGAYCIDRRRRGGHRRRAGLRADGRRPGAADRLGEPCRRAARPPTSSARATGRRYREVEPAAWRRWRTRDRPPPIAFIDLAAQQAARIGDARSTPRSPGARPRRATSSGPEVAELEAELAAFCGAGHVVTLRAAAPTRCCCALMA